MAPVVYGFIPLHKTNVVLQHTGKVKKPVTTKFIKITNLVGN